jgi:hypothetical protein
VYDQFVSADEASIRSHYFIRKTEIIGGLNYATKRYLELQIKTLQNAPRDPDKLERLLKAKRRQKEEAMHIEETHTNPSHSYSSSYNNYSISIVHRASSR